MAAGELAYEDVWWAEVREQRLLGFLLFLISDSILFGTFIFAYLYLRNSVPHAAWPPPGTERPALYLAAINSIVLFGSGVTMHYAMEGMRRARLDRFFGFVLATIVLGSLFLAGQAYEYFHILPVTKWATNTFGASFFTLTGMHGFHVFIGVWFLSIVLLQTAHGKYTPQRHFGLTAATLYWHFVDVIWVALFTLFYVY